MKKSFIRHIFAVSILSCCLLFGGCSQNSDGEETSSATTASTSPSETVAALPADVSPDSESSAIESTSEDTRALTLSVVNMCGIEVGMVAVIDPVTGEQVNLDSLSDQESISMEADWTSSLQALDKLEEEVRELRAALEAGQAADAPHGIREELGDTLFMAAKIAQMSGVDPEDALHRACDKFDRRFRAVEEAADKPLPECGEAELLALWNDAKSHDPS